jgi:hypothetical protein
MLISSDQKNYTIDTLWHATQAIRHHYNTNIVSNRNVLPGLPIPNPVFLLQPYNAADVTQARNHGTLPLAPAAGPGRGGRGGAVPGHGGRGGRGGAALGPGGRGGRGGAALGPGGRGGRGGVAPGPSRGGRGGPPGPTRGPTRPPVTKGNVAATNPRVNTTTPPYQPDPATLNDELPDLEGSSKRKFDEGGLCFPERE